MEFQELQDKIKQLRKTGQLSTDAADNALQWLQPEYNTIREGQWVVQSLLSDCLENHQITEIENRFYTQLAPGTAGIRGRMGIGSALINAATVGLFAQAHASFLNKHPDPNRSGILLGYDSRAGSYDMEIKGPGFLTQMIAEIYAAAGIPVYVSDKPLPTPVVAHALVEVPMGPDNQLPQSAGICTASHNPKEDNGYKIYEADGHQIVSAEFKKNMQEEMQFYQAYHQVRRASPDQGWPSSNKELNQKLAAEGGQWILATEGASITLVDSQKIIKAYAAKASQVAIDPTDAATGKVPFTQKTCDALAKSPFIITALKGNCAATTQCLLETHGLQEGVHYYFEPSEREPDNSLDTGTGNARGKPNPEYAESFHRSIQYARQLQEQGVPISAIFASDPDSDRVGILEFQLDGTCHYFSGNEQLSLNAAYESLRMEEPRHALIIKSIPSGNQLVKIYRKNWPDVTVLTVLVGFKYFGQVIAHYNRRAIHWQGQQKPSFDRKAYAALSLAERHNLLHQSGAKVFMSGGEESMGQTYGNDCAEKDTPRAMARFAEIKGWLTCQNLSMHSFLESLQDHYGFCAETLVQSRFPGARGDQLKQQIMHLHRNPKKRPQKFGSQKVVCTVDYLKTKNQDPSCMHVDGTKLFDRTLHEATFRPPGTNLSLSTFYVDLGHGDGFALDSADYIQYVLENGSTVHIRPSGTEPILKQYLNFELSDTEITALPALAQILTANTLYWNHEASSFQLTPPPTQESLTLGSWIKMEDIFERRQQVIQKLQKTSLHFTDWNALAQAEKIIFMKDAGFFREVAQIEIEHRFQEASTILQNMIQQAKKELAPES